MRVLLTAGYDRAPQVLALAELLRRRGVTVAGVIVVSPLRWKRLTAMVRQRGYRSLLPAARRLAGRRPSSEGDGPIEIYLRQQSIRHRSLKRWCRDYGVTRCVVPTLNGTAAVAFARSANIDGVLYGGGGILHRGFLEAVGGRVLNAHSGPLPGVRGMNACEWSILLGLHPCVTIHVIDRGIDTGAVLKRIPLDVSPGDSIATLRDRCVVLGVEGLLACVERLREPLPVPEAHVTLSRQCFVMAPALLDLVRHRLDSQR